MPAVRLLACLLVLSVAGCGGAPIVSIENNSRVLLTNVVVAGSGFSEQIGELQLGAKYSFPPRPRGDSGILVKFDAGGQHYDASEQSYFESTGNYRVSISVDSEMKVTVESTMQ